MTARPDQPLGDVRRDYRVGLLRSLSRRNEDALSAGYDLGRQALEGRVSMLDLVRIHHDVLAEVLRESRGDDVGRVVAAAGEFLVETLAALELARRIYSDRRAGGPANSTAGRGPADPDASPGRI